MLDADRMKVILIDYLLDTSEPDLLVSEFTFLQGYRKADLVAFGTDQITAFEIKSPRDKLTRLSTQMADYSSVFTYCYLVTTSHHLKPAREMISPRIGLIVIDEGRVVVIRNSTENRRLSKESLSSSIPSNRSSAVIEGDSIPGRIRATYNHRRSTTELKQDFYVATFEKYKKRYRGFLLDRGSKTTLTDLYYLQSR